MTAAHDPVRIFRRLQATETVEIDGWSLGVSDDLIWLTNPYGLDVGFYDCTPASCRRILEIIAADDHDRELGML